MAVYLLVAPYGTYAQIRHAIGISPSRDEARTLARADYGAPGMNSVAAPFRCPRCHAHPLRADHAAVTCVVCPQIFGVRYGIIDFLSSPDGAVARELQGLAAENDIDIQDDFDCVKFLRTDHIETTAELMAGSRNERTRYYQQTSAAYYEGLARALPDAGIRVLEIGSERTYFKLRTIKDLCDEAFALNIFFHVTSENEQLDWPTRVLGDMNELPFADEYFDLLICSATLHHTGTLDKALAEVARVLRPGGRAVVVNEPVEGWLKARGLRRGLARHDRDDDIHEDPVTRKQWRTAIRASGLEPEYFVPAWFLQQVGNAQSAPDDMRFGRLARAMRPLLVSPAMKDLARTIGRVPGQALLGLPLNALLWKRAS